MDPKNGHQFSYFWTMSSKKYMYKYNDLQKSKKTEISLIKGGIPRNSCLANGEVEKRKKEKYSCILIQSSIDLTYIS